MEKTRFGQNPASLADGASPKIVADGADRAGGTAPGGGTAPATSRTPSDLPGVLDDPALRDLLALCARRGILRRDFDALPMPAGLSADQAWGLLSSIRRSQAIHYRDLSYNEGRLVGQWYTPTYAIEAKLRDLALRTGTGSRLETALHERHGRRFIARSLVEETVAAVSCDGLDIDYERARSVITGERQPATPVERLVANTHTLLTGLLDADGAPITVERIRAMYRALTEGIDARELHCAVPWGLEWPEDPVDGDEALETICAMAAGTLVDPAEHPIVTAQRLICKFWKTAPFPGCNYIMGSLVSRLHMKLAGFPVFVYIPSSRMTLAWKHGDYADERICPYPLAGNVTGDDRDWTPYWESCLQLLVDELDKLERDIFQLKEHDDRLLVRLQDDRSFNHRQREVLCQAVLVPEATFKIEAHRQAHGLAYSTARQDLTSLVERGLLEMHYESKAQVFAARFDMKRVLAERYGL